MNIWTRQEAFIKPDEQKKLANSCVLVAGVGANGSVTAETLTRVGVGTIVLADPDHVEVNNLNRQNYTANDVDKLKVSALKERLLAIQPELTVQLVPEGITLKNALSLVESCDVILDCCDNYPAKVILSRCGKRLNKAVVHSAGGAVRGAVTVFSGSQTYEKLFELPTIGIDDNALNEVDFIQHRRKVIERLGANLFDKQTKANLFKEQYAQWPTIVGACDIAAHLSALQTVWLLLKQIEYLILAPKVLVFDARTCQFEKKDFSKQKEHFFD